MKLYQIISNFIEHYRSLFLDRGANGPEIIVTTALVIIGAVTLWVFGGMLVQGARAAWRRLRSNRNMPLVVALYFGALVIFGTLAFAVTLPVTSNSSYCGRVCHSMNPEFQSWRRSSHANIPCSACHTDVSFKGLMNEKLVFGFREIGAEVTGHYPKPINAGSSYSRTQVPNDRCLRCHSPRNRVFSVRLGLNMNHPAHLNAGLRCTYCHNRIAHPQADKYSPLKEQSKGFKYKDYLTMRQGCWRCHRTGGRFVDAGGVAHKGPFVAVSGKQAPTDCRTCHNTDWKVMPAFHQPTNGVPWARGLAHGETARKNFKACTGCHDPNVWCSTRCHKGITMPHVAGWAQTHRVIARQDIKRCYACHKVGPGMYFCGKRCHHDPFIKQFNLNPKGAWSEGKVQHGVVVLATGGKPCWRCHDQKTWCTTQCHKGITMPHVANWKSVHFTYVQFVRGDGWQRKSAPCTMCHNKAGTDNNYCFTCHHKQWPGMSWYGLMHMLSDENGPYQVDGLLNLNPGQTIPCQQCHIHKDLTFCINCHIGKGDRNLAANEGK